MQKFARDFSVLQVQRHFVVQRIAIGIPRNQPLAIYRICGLTEASGHENDDGEQG
jgi:hypothetical protein